MSVNGRACEASATPDSHSRITCVLGKDEEDGELAGSSHTVTGSGGGASVSEGSSVCLISGDELHRGVSDPGDICLISGDELHRGVSDPGDICLISGDELHRGVSDPGD